MKQLLIVFSLLVVATACFSRSTVMSRSSFEEIQIGEPVHEMEAKVGQPYAIRTKGDGKEEYEYVERVNVAGENVFQNHYYIIVQEGRVVDKRAGRERPPAYDLINEDDPNNITQY